MTDKNISANIKDRGKIKWTSLMLVEHREALRKLLLEQQDIEKPILDEQEKQRLEQLLQKAIRDNMNVRITYYQDKRLLEITGEIKIKHNQIYIDQNRLAVKDIIDIKII